jgi:CheY-like chemotaxis protein/HPt (histidine-containing phosphotransfer) domain-containing protein
MQMPGQDGVALAHQIRAEPRWTGLKLILLTSMGQTNLMGPEFDAVLSKPLRRERLRQTLFRLCRTDHAPQEKVIDQPGRPRSAALRILVAEDNPINLLVVMRMLENLGHRPVAVGQGQEVIEAVKTTAFDLVLMDCQMPVMDGFEATRRLRRGDAGERGKSLPVIALTAHAFKGDDEKCRRAGMDDYLTKPLRDHELVRMLERWSGGTERAEKEKPATKENMIFEAQLLPTNLDSTSMAREVVGEFLQDFQNRLEAMKRYRHNQDVDGFNREAHSIKGAAATIGAWELSDEAGQFQNQAAQFPECNRLEIAFARLKTTLAEVSWMKNS